MTTYVYRYTDADNETVEVSQSMTDDALTSCPTTGRPVERIVVLAGDHRIGGKAHGNTTMWNVSNDPGPRRKGYDVLE